MLWTFGGNPGQRVGVLGVYNGHLYATSFDGCGFFRYDGGTRWTRLKCIPETTQTYSIAVHQGKMCVGTWSNGLVYRYDSSNTWTSLGRLGDETEIEGMVVYNGKLFAGTLPSGHVYSLKAGECVTYDKQLQPGWRHVAAIRKAGVLELHVDGRRVAHSSAFNPRDYDLSNTQPLRIGFGQHDYLNGRMKNLRIYDRALQEAEIRKLSNRR